MLAITNPYDRVNIDAIPIEEIGIVRDRRVFHIKTSAVEPFDACVLRRHLVDFLFDHMNDEWKLGNDGQYVKFEDDDLALALSDRDADKFICYGWLV